MFRNVSFLCGGIVAIAPAFAATAPLPQAVESAISKGDYAGVETALKEALSKDTLVASDAQVMHRCMLLELIRETGADIMSGFAASSKSKASFLKAFVHDTQWLELYLTAGLVPYQTEVGIDVLYRIWKDQKGEVANKPLATALASAWGGGETDPNPPILQKDPSKYNPVRRYNFFEKQKEQGLLHPNYSKLRPWELRFVVSIPQQDWDDESYEWAAKNINMPWDKYGSACWAAPYTDPSKFGDDVQCGLYNLPFSDLSNAETTVMNGGVCGALSHLGAVAAMAHGIPAYTCGQPAHCAYAVRPERGNWVGGFGGPDGGMHNRIFGNQAPTSNNLMEAVFAKDSVIAAAYKESFIARAKEALGDTAGALQSWKSALEKSPLHPIFRTQEHRLMLDAGLSPDECAGYLATVLPLYEGHGYAAQDMIKDLSPVINQLNDKQKIDIYGEIHKLIATSRASWVYKCNELCQAHMGTLSSDAAKKNYLGNALSAHINSEDGTVFGQLLEWGVKEFVEKGDAETFATAFSMAAANTKAVSGKDAADTKKKVDAISKAYAKAIIATEHAHSAVAFDAISKAAAKAVGPAQNVGQLTKTGEMKGQLAKPILFRISTTSSWDSPVRHAGIMTLEGGHSHTSKEAKPNFIVELDKAATLTGCIIRKCNGFEERMKKAIVYTSTDGATWMKRAEIADMPKEWAVQFPAGTPGKWVKLEFENEGAGNFAHISHFVIYSK